MNDPMFRPPAEAGSLILQIDRGCPHNRCTFCGMYREQEFLRRPLDDVRALIRSESIRDPDARRIFLADGDVMHRPFEEWRVILDEIIVAFPAVTRINTYANGRSITAKTDSQLRSLRERRLNTLYMGLESGDDVVLRMCRKGESSEGMVEAGIAAQAAGLRMSVMILLGLGGQDRTVEHAERTADALNRMQPRLLSALRVIPIPGTGLQTDIEEGRFRPLSEYGTVQELRMLVDRLDLCGTIFRANHVSNVVPVEARLPRDKRELLGRLDALLHSGPLDRDGTGPLPLWL